MPTFDEILGDRPIMAILRGVPPAEAVTLAEAVWDTGIGAVEVPIQTPEALDALAAVARAGAARGEVVGAGTVIAPEQVALAKAAGAVYTVAPGLDLDVLRTSVAAGLPHLPGVGSASEVQQAMRAGCRWLKAFPAGSLGASWLRDIRGPFPDALLVATGGVTAANAAEFRSAGARCLGIGNALTRPGGLAEIMAALT
ncbi:2-keto-3-deoxy-phosphogluconate aldolase [Micromonospora pallida]|uniref:2-keto-3-deoxy-phosphogluconate aldolase n=1 Tax=Micromonospora pallida TaxID=145854 RepID=A0A1C6SBK1_9ACTN|nr:bifunctional 4-hydroxy-2-oxoglutarate aldolase/2-dehydro-3-deoxy-phosphogluconate aldolase [Micromonospora pallida]SCL26775.1 2-keto-3-deoxy-phosphogluconate aldolase [Micromonospora pallida]